MSVPRLLGNHAFITSHLDYCNSLLCWYPSHSEYCFLLGNKFIQICLIDWLIILFQLSNILSTNTIFNGRAIFTPFKHHSYIGEIYIFTYNTIKINKNIKTYKNHFNIELWSSMERNNYRPISILPILSKVLERFLHTSFTVFLEEFKLLTVAQSGFRQLHSTVTALLQVSDRWLENIDKGLVTGVVSIDLRKAFETVDLDILLANSEFWCRRSRTSMVSELPHWQNTVCHCGWSFVWSLTSVNWCSTGLNFKPIVVFTIFKWFAHNPSIMRNNYVCWRYRMWVSFKTRRLQRIRNYH